MTRKSNKYNTNPFENLAALQSFLQKSSDYLKLKGSIFVEFIVTESAGFQKYFNPTVNTERLETAIQTDYSV